MTVASIIICTRDRAESLRRTLESVLALVIPDKFSVELLIIDNGSKDHTKRVVEAVSSEKMAVRYIHEDRAGLCHARNRGLKECRGDIIVFTDDDVRVPSDWIAIMCKPIINKTADGVQGSVFPASHLDRHWLRGIYRSALAIVEPKPNEVPESLTGANMAFSRKVLNTNPSFCVELGAGALGFGDDTLWGFELIRSGYRLAFADGQGVEHHFDSDRLTAEYFLRWAKKNGESQAFMDVKKLNRAPRRPRLSFLWVIAKYSIRRLLDWRAHPVPPEWRIYYGIEIAYFAKCAQLMQSGSTSAQLVERPSPNSI